MPFDISTIAHGALITSFVLAIGIASFSIWKRPLDVDRIVALEWLGGISIALAAYLAMKFNDEKMIDIAIVLSTLGYLSTTFLSKWQESKNIK
jgi:multisubunit Na+/H+ antiporter MnhF subunit